jgi:hypothetical protein
LIAFLSSNRTINKNTYIAYIAEQECAVSEANHIFNNLLLLQHFIKKTFWKLRRSIDYLNNNFCFKKHI